MTLRLNCDLGEGFGRWELGADQLAMPHIDMANIACGFHASDPTIMTSTVKLAKKHQVEIGAHPGYPDLQGFGRRSLAMSQSEITASVLYQVGALQAIAKGCDAQVTYVKPHGALYNDMMRNLSLFEGVVMACQSLALPLMMLATSDNGEHKQLAKQYMVRTIDEGFCDRRYQDNGQLVPRSEAGAVLTDSTEILRQVTLLCQGKVETDSGKLIDLHLDTLCVHGDNPDSCKQIEAIRAQIHA